MEEPAAASAPAPVGRLRTLGKACLVPGTVVLAHVLAFTVARAALLLLYPKDFVSLGGGTRAAAFLRGLRYDFSILSLVAGLPVLMLLLPFGWARTRAWRHLWGWISFGLFVLCSAVLASDVLYFGHVHRHAGLETAALGETLKAVSGSAVQTYLLPLLGFSGVVLALGWGWRRLLRPDRAAAPVALQAGVALAALALFYYGERGTLWGKRLRVVHAFDGLPEPAAHLALNGPFCILHSLVHARPVPAEFYPWPEALRTARDAVFAPGESAADPEYPLLRSRPAREAGHPNIVLIMLESWDASAVDAHREQMGLPPRGLTPGYDALSRKGRLFTRFYATGQRSMEGMSALLCGFPTLPGTPYLGQGLEQSTLTALGRLGREEGYETWFIQSSERDSFRCDAIAPRLGFDHYLGAEDIPAEPPDSPRDLLRGACWDHEMFAEAGRKLASSRQPFLAFLYTNSTHPPFFWPGDRWKRRPGDGLEARYENSLAYSDWALGRFFEAARASGWSERTVFLITADHLGGPGGEVRADRPESKHHIPCLLLAPGVAAGVDGRIGSQLDVLPTLGALAGWGSPQAALGCSLLADPAAGRGALCVEGPLVLRIEDGGVVVHDLGVRVSGRSAPGADLDAIERRLLSLAQTSYRLLRGNRVDR